MKAEIYRVKEEFQLPWVDHRSRNWYVNGIKKGILVVAQTNSAGRKWMTKLGHTYEWLFMDQKPKNKVWLDWEEFKDKFEPVLIEQLTYQQQASLIYTLHNWHSEAYLEFILTHDIIRAEPFIDFIELVKKDS